MVWKEKEGRGGSAGRAGRAGTGFVSEVQGAGFAG